MELLSEKSPSSQETTTAPSACGGKARTTESQPASRQVRASSRERGCWE